MDDAHTEEPIEIVGLLPAEVKESDMNIACPGCQSKNLKIHQRNGHPYSTMYRCANCQRFFSARHFTGYAGLRLPPEKIAHIVHCLVEGVSIRATARLLDVEKKTVIRIMLHAARRCQRAMESRLYNLKLRFIQADELWCFVGKKEQNLFPFEKRGNRHIGDTWIFLATDAETKLVPTFRVGNRDTITATSLMHDLAGRLAARPQITSDGLRAYIWAVERAFGADVDYGMLIKEYAEREGMLDLVSARPKPISGNPDPNQISTSYAERNNLNCRTFLRRLTRLTNGFSKKLENLVAMLWVYFAHYNFVRIHGSLRVTPAMAAGVTDHVWTIDELMNAGDLNRAQSSD